MARSNDLTDGSASWADNVRQILHFGTSDLPTTATAAIYVRTGTGTATGLKVWSNGFEGMYIRASSAMSIGTAAAGATFSGAFTGARTIKVPDADGIMMVTRRSIFPTGIVENAGTATNAGVSLTVRGANKIYRVRGEFVYTCSSTTVGVKIALTGITVAWAALHWEYGSIAADTGIGGEFNTVNGPPAADGSYLVTVTGYIMLDPTMYATIDGTLTATFRTEVAGTIVQQNFAMLELSEPQNS